MKKFFDYYQQAMGILSFVTFMLLIISLAFPWCFSQPLFTIWLIAWFLECRWLNLKNFRWGKPLIPVLILCGFVAWEALSLLWTQDVSSGKSELERHLPMFGLLLMSLFGWNEHYKAYRLKTALLVGCLVAVVSYSIVIYWHAHMGTIHQDPTFSYWTMFGEGPIQFLKHRLYLCIVLMLAVFFSGDVYHHFAQQYHKYSCMATIGIADIILLAAVFLTGSRTTIMLLPIVGLVWLAIKLPARIRWYVISGAAVLFIAGGSLLMRYNWRFQNMKHDLEILISQKAADPSVYEPRVYIWSTVLRHADEYGLAGMGAGSSDKFLLKCYEQDHYTRDFGSHNNYLYVWMDYGYIGLVYLILALIAVPLFHTGHARTNAALVSALFGWSMFTENLLTMMSALYIIFALIAIIQITQHEQDSQLPARP